MCLPRYWGCIERLDVGKRCWAKPCAITSLQSRATGWASRARATYSRALRGQQQARRAGRPWRARQAGRPQRVRRARRARQRRAGLEQGGGVTGTEAGGGKRGSGNVDGTE
ncbi:hypothetical protein M758_1G083000 [Ceratodon purpureus]|nr:hypothetical protein M758_1G083000 [Ceratodon purpureus]